MTFSDDIHYLLTQLAGAHPTYKQGNLYDVHILSKYSLTIWTVSLKAYREKQPDPQYLLTGLKKTRDSLQKVVIIWEDQWIQKPKILEARIRSLLNITERVHARKCHLKMLNKNEMTAFLNENHLLGSTNVKFRYALIDNSEEIQAVAGFGRSVPVQRDDKTFKSYELIRFCHKGHHHVSGGLSKLLKHFIRNEHPDDIYTSIDRDWSDGKGYYSIGFRYLGETPPICFALDKNGKRVKCTNKPDVCNTGNIKMVWKLI